jgi:hypothetical protein
MAVRNFALLFRNLRIIASRACEVSKNDFIKKAWAADL